MTTTARRIESHDIKSIIQWLEEEITEGENGILVYPNSPTFREIYMQYAKNQLAQAREGQQQQSNGISLGNCNNNDNDDSIDKGRLKEQPLLMQPRILLIATFYDTVNSVKHNLTAVGVDVQSHIDDGSLLIVDAFNAYFPDIDGMKKLVSSLSERARKESRVGVSVIINTGFFFLYGRDVNGSNLINYEGALSPNTGDADNVRSFSCYHVKNYRKLNDSQKSELFTQGQKKFLEVIESVAASV